MANQLKIKTRWNDDDFDDELLSFSSEKLIEELENRGDVTESREATANIARNEFSRMNDSEKYVFMADVLGIPPYSFQKMKEEFNRILDAGISEREKKKIS